ncbi:acetylcholinesterase, putative [Ixodes scapularis]|uniref:Acetylcholinesterase, putative n=1 Tax=Ixodes scapularis TaxID=6945 RepID=B7QIQ2_IXOSC|nr:acetylcholinesterase, putative [Ixodes scapularis]|eukprot:XP_002415059.1 acetylcholinesterase, putative [Ixodes scapularis]
MTGAEPLLSVSTLAHPSKANASIISVGPPDMLAPKGSSQQQATEFYNSTAFACMIALKKQRNPSIYSLEVASLAWRLEQLVDTHIVMSGLPKCRIEPLKTQPEVSSFLGEIFPSSGSALYTGSLTEVMVRSPAFLDTLISLVHSTEPYILMNYIGVRLMIAVAPFAPSSGRLLVQTMVEHQYGRARPSLPRWKLCIRTVERAIPDLFLHAVRLAYKTQFAMDSVQRLLDSIRQSLAGDLAKLAVLDQESRAQALALLNVTQFRLFRPSWLTNKEKLESYVSALPRVVRGQNLRSFHALHSHSFAERLRRDQADRWQGSAFDHDCSYDGKVVFVPVLLFNFSVFHRGANQNLELPHAGVRLTRCLLQLLLANISQGATAAGGRLWWPDMASSFLADSQLCFQQYGLPHVGSLQLLEYTAAIKPAMDLYQEDKRVDIRFDTLPAYSAVHLFYVYYALSFCQESKSDNATEVVSYLTNVPLWNNRLFQETFRCPVGSHMNPPNKCVLWREAH